MPSMALTAAVSTILQCCRYKELRKEGKLHKFMEKRRKKNSNKDHRWLPGRRGDSAEE